MTTYSIIDESGETRLVGTISPAPGGGSQALTVVRQLTNAEILNLHATEVELIDAPGVGKAIQLQELTMVLDQSNGAYNGDDGGELDAGFSGFWNDIGANYFAGLDQGSILTASGVPRADTYGASTGGSSRQAIWDLSLIANLPFCIGNIGGAELGGGGTGNTLSVRVTYTIEDTVAFTS